MDFQEFLRKLGTTIRAHRKAVGLTQEELAAELNVSTQWVSEMERGNGAPSLELLHKLGGYMKTTVSDLTRVVPTSSQDDEALREIVIALEHQSPEVLRAAADLASSLSRAQKG